jgi:uncharacterized SAM-binding protein YcdF (DUF218 family)
MVGGMASLIQIKTMKKIFLVILFLSLFSYSYLNLGKWLDITNNPVESDIIVCLGGGDYHRIDKAISLYRAGYSIKHLIVLTGDDVTPERKRAGYKDFRVRMLDKKYAAIPYVHFPGLSSTREEALFIKHYMHARGYRSALIVTDPPHSRRVKILLSILDRDLNSEMKFLIVGSGVRWWDGEHYYRNGTARYHAMIELMKIPYNLYKIYINELEKWLENAR